jgi:hypothetical protein
VEMINARSNHPTTENTVLFECLLAAGKHQRGSDAPELTKVLVSKSTENLVALSPMPTLVVPYRKKDRRGCVD